MYIPQPLLRRIDVCITVHHVVVCINLIEHTHAEYNYSDILSYSTCD